MDNRTIADINIAPSIKPKLIEMLDPSKGNEHQDLSLFENLNVESEWEAYMLLGFTISEYALERVFLSKSSKIQL
ncbi:hypothetical protein [Methanolobus psychrotolerans]|uniref:hypothetical protein n=1 Tax=Methanolobus psychrotolerans TaxID=1874706 RepID=UPI000B91BC4E|nr:hypothetical protein [Methanolobus psychrotolerans]